MLHIPDWLAVELPSHEHRVRAAEGTRSSVMVPIRLGDETIGVLGLTRQQPGEFGAAEIAVAHTFVDQAAIAIRNVHLFNETREALERQTATAEVLRVLGSSMTDTQPVFDAIVGNCGRLFATAASCSG